MPKSRGRGAASESCASGLPAEIDTAAQRIDAVCRLTVAGKLAARDLTTWLRRFAVNETEFRLLWLLFRNTADESADASRGRLDQAELAARLVVSAAQVSGAVERLQLRQLVAPLRDSNDRRRQCWQLAEAGDSLVRAVMASVAARSDGTATVVPSSPTSMLMQSQEAA